MHTDLFFEILCVNLRFGNQDVLTSNANIPNCRLIDIWVLWFTFVCLFGGMVIG